MTPKSKRRECLRYAIAQAGGIVAFSRKLGVTHQAVYGWAKRNAVPLPRAIIIERHFGVPRTDLVNDALRAALAVPRADICDLL